ncbi:MAG TPA: SCP2 sterol-binding domain-containing protein [Candidatus Binatia bacterium]|nr:SCP2 sterol-binding domain-containing protein [Candidatus Binatia bacterium]
MAPVTGATAARAPGWMCAALEIALNRFLALEPEVLKELARLAPRVIVLQVEGPDWEFFIEPHAGGVRVLDESARADVRIAAPMTRLVRQAFRTDGSAISGLRVEGDAELLSRFSALLAKVGFDPEEWLSKWLGDAAGHRAGQALKGLLDWGRRTAGTLALDTAEYLREETGDLAHRADVERWMDEVDRLRERADRLAARMDRVERKLPPGGAA